MYRILVVSSIVAFAHSAHAQPARPSATLPKRIEAIEKQLAELSASTVQLPTLATSVQDLTARLTELRRRFEVLSRSQKGVPDAVRLLDELGARVAALERRVAAVQTEVAGIGQPASPEPEGAGTSGMAFDRGFVWKTADERYSIRIGGLLQGRYQLDLDEALDDAQGAGLALRRARLSVAGSARALRYELELEALSAAPLLDGFVDYRLHRFAVVRLGQYKTPFTRNFSVDSNRMIFSERPAAIDALRYDRDVQVGVWGRLGVGALRYYAGVGNGAGRNRLNDNLDVAAVARLDAVLLGSFGSAPGLDYGANTRNGRPALILGGGVVHDLVAVPDQVGEVVVANTDVDGNGKRDNIRAISASLDAVFRAGGLELAVEGVLRAERWGAILEGNPALTAAIGDMSKRRTYAAVTGQVTYLFGRRIMGGARICRGKLPFLGLGGLPGQLWVTDQQVQLDAVVQLLDRRGDRLLGLTYSFWNHLGDTDPPGENTRSFRLILEAQRAL